MTRSGTAALTLSDEIRQRFDEFSRSQKDVGQYIVDHLEEVAFHTAEELARRAGLRALDVTDGVPHVFQAFSAMLDEADAALVRAAAFLRKNLAVTERLGTA